MNVADVEHLQHLFGLYGGVVKKFNFLEKDKMQQILNTLLTYNPRFLLLSNLKFKLITKDTDLMANKLTAATRLIAGSWKSEIIPSLDCWFFKVKHAFLLSKLMAINKYRMGFL